MGSGRRGVPHGKPVAVADSAALALDTQLTLEPAGCAQRLLLRAARDSVARHARGAKGAFQPSFARLWMRGAR